MKTTDDVHDVGVYISREIARPSSKKMKIYAPGIGIIYVEEGSDYISVATRWISMLKGWPVETINVFNVNGCG